MSTKFVMPLSGANGSVVNVSPVAAVIGTTCGISNTSCPDNGICPTVTCMFDVHCIVGTHCNNFSCTTQNCTPAQPAGFNITQITGPHNTPTEIQLGNVTKCSIDAYAFYDGDSIYTPDKDGVVNRDLSADYGCDFGRSDSQNFGKIFSGNTVGWSLFFPSLSTVIDGYTAIPSHNYTLHKNYCAITLNMKTGKSCADLNFGNGNYHFKNDANNRIMSAFSVTDLSSIKVRCGTDSTSALITYPVTNSIVTFDHTKSPPTIEFTPNNDEDLGCSYQHNGTNYVAFSCSADNSSVEAVEYRCGL